MDWEVLRRILYENVDNLEVTPRYVDVLAASIHLLEEGKISVTRDEVAKKNG